MTASISQLAFSALARLAIVLRNVCCASVSGRSAWRAASLAPVFDAALPSSTISALSRATSIPDPMATPTVASVSAGHR